MFNMSPLLCLVELEAHRSSKYLVNGNPNQHAIISIVFSPIAVSYFIFSTVLFYHYKTFLFSLMII